MDILQKMREDWNRRAKEDAHYYVAFAGEQQSEATFLSTAGEVIAKLEAELTRLPSGRAAAGRALDIGCGPGRLMMPMSRHFAEIHGVDVAEEMVTLARQRLSGIPNAQAHVNSGSDLSLFADDWFDFVYSWIVFQHIPSKEIVLSYLREAQRVLRPGGVVACQLRGSSPIATELRPGMETWTGCWFGAEEIYAFSAMQKFPLVAISGMGTQYMVTVFRKPAGAEQAPSDNIVLKDVTAASGGQRRIPARGREAAVSLWIDRFPEGGGLAEFPVQFGETLQTGCYLSPVSESGGCQLNATLPSGLPPGRVRVCLTHRGTPIGQAHEIEVLPAPPRDPKILRVMDHVNQLSERRIENDGMKVSIEDVDDPAQVSFAVGGRRADFVIMDCADPITSTYIFGFPVPRGTRKGSQRLTARVGARELPAVEIEIA
jgi:ubiquinone/menaquinone biosynthesis C-methylase UbiE